MDRGSVLDVYEYVSVDNREAIANTIEALMQHPKGMLSADETERAIGMKLEEIQLENNEENRRLYRQLVVKADTAEYFSGMCLNHESFYQRDDDAFKFTSFLQQRGILVGVRLDTGLFGFFKGGGEFMTEGLDNLAERLKLYKMDGCKFAKWRCGFVLSSKHPSTYCIEENVNFMSRFAAAAQSHGIVPLLSVEIIPDGSFTMERCRRTLERILTWLLASLSEHNVYIEGVLLQTNMVRPGQQSAQEHTPEEVAEATLTAFQRTLPPALPGILLASGGLSEEETTITLQTIRSKEDKKTPWKMSFDFSRALQESALRVWMGKADNVPSAQEELRKRAEANSLALKGEYVPGSVEGAASHLDLFRPFYICNR